MGKEQSNRSAVAAYYEKSILLPFRIARIFAFLGRYWPHSNLNCGWGRRGRGRGTGTCIVGSERRGGEGGREGERERAWCLLLCSKNLPCTARSNLTEWFLCFTVTSPSVWTTSLVSPHLPLTVRPELCSCC